MRRALTNNTQKKTISIIPISLKQKVGYPLFIFLVTLCGKVDNIQTRDYH